MKASTIDRVGVSLSALCIVHCLVLPVIITTLPFMAILAEDERVHRGLVMIAIVPAILAFARPLRRKHGHLIRGTAFFGISLLFVGAFIEAFHDMETSLTVMGALSLASAHIWKSLTAKSHNHAN